MNKIILIVFGALGGGVMGEWLAKIISQNLFQYKMVNVFVVVIMVVLGMIVGYQVSKEVLE